MIQLSSESPEKLKKTTEWVGRLRRVVELFNRCIDACKGEELNEVRIAIVEGFSKLANCSDYEFLLTMQIRYFPRSPILSNIFALHLQVNYCTQVSALHSTDLAP